MASYHSYGVVEANPMISNSPLQPNFISNWPRSWIRCSVCFNQVSFAAVTYFGPTIAICYCCQDRGRTVENMDFNVSPANVTVNANAVQPYQVEGLPVMRAQCEFFASGCDRESTIQDITNHGFQCGFRDIKCYEPTYLVSSSRWDDCKGMKVPLAMYQKHLSEVHSYPMHYGPSITIYRCIEAPLDHFGGATYSGWNRWHPISIFHDGFGFLWHCYVYSQSESEMSEGVVYTWLTILADQGWANRYLYKLEMQMPGNPDIRWTWDLPVVQFHDFSMPSDHSASIPVGTLKKLVDKQETGTGPGYGMGGFELKLTISNTMFDRCVVDNVQQPTFTCNGNGSCLAIQDAPPLPPMPTPTPTPRSTPTPGYSGANAPVASSSRGFGRGGRSRARH